MYFDFYQNKFNIQSKQWIGYWTSVKTIISNSTQNVASIKCTEMNTW